MDTLGLPRAVADLESDRFIFANNSFLRVAGLKEFLVPSLALSRIVEIHADPSARKTGQLIPIMVESYDQGFIIRGHAVFGENSLIYLMIPLFGDPSADFELGRSVGKEQERQWRSRYVHERLAPELRSAIRSIEAARSHLADEHGPFDAELEKIALGLTGLLQTTCTELLEEPERLITVKAT